MYRFFKAMSAPKKKPQNRDMPEYPPDIETDRNMPHEYPYRKRKLLTRSEYAFWNILRTKANEAGLVALTKVRLEDIVEVYNTREINRFRGYIKSRHIDFVLRNSYMDVLTVIELDGSSHSKDGSDKSDVLKNNIFKTVGIPLVRVRVGETYESAINEIISRVTGTAEKENKS